MAKNENELENTEVTSVEGDELEITLPADSDDNDNDDNDDVSLPAFGEINPEDLESDDTDDALETDVDTNTKSLIGMLVNKKYSQLKKDVEEIVANKIASKIQDKKDELRASGYRTVGIPAVANKPEV